MSDERFVLKFNSQENEYFIRDNFEEEEELGSYTLKWGVRKLNEQQASISKLEEEKGYWKSKAMTLLMQVRRLIPRMSAKEVIEFGKELEDE